MRIVGNTESRNSCDVCWIHSYVFDMVNDVLNSTSHRCNCQRYSIQLYKGEKNTPNTLSGSNIFCIYSFTILSFVLLLVFFFFSSFFLLVRRKKETNLFQLGEKESEREKKTLLFPSTAIWAHFKCHSPDVDV